MDWTQAERMSAEGHNAGEIARTLGLDYERTRNHIKKWRRKNGMNRANHGKSTTEIPGGSFAREERVASRYTYTGGLSVYEDEQRIIDGQEITPEIIMRAKGLKVEEWEVVHFTKNVWQQQTKEGGTIDMCQSKLTVKPRQKAEPTLEELEAFFRDKQFASLPPIPPRPDPQPGDLVLEIDMADLHSGLFAWGDEAGEDFDLEICRERFLEAVRDIRDRARGKGISQIYLCALGDILHIDNDLNTTTKGTVQQADGRVAQIFDYTFDTVNMGLALLRELSVPIHYIYTAGNHDRNVGYYLVRCLEKANPDILFDLKPNPQKAIHFGKVLVGLTHGDMPTKNRGKWLMTDYRKQFGESRWVEEHSGHIHEEEARSIHGILCRSMPTLTGASAWEHQQGYRSDRAMQCFLWSRENGLCETWYARM